MLYHMLNYMDGELMWAEVTHGEKYFARKRIQNAVAANFVLRVFGAHLRTQEITRARLNALLIIVRRQKRMMNDEL